MELALLISAEAHSAYFAEYSAVAQAELAAVIPGVEAKGFVVGDMQFLKANVAEEHWQRLPSLSFVQGVFRVEGEHWQPLDLAAQWQLPRDFVFGSKFKGKTNERLTQLLINVALARVATRPVKLFDPMCGRGTTLLWAMRYGIEARGLDRDPKALQDFGQIVKKWNTVHETGLSFSEGFTGKKSKTGLGKYLEVASATARAKMIVGDAQAAPEALRGEMFELIVSDLPYGVQHVAGAGRRSPEDIIRHCAQPWATLLKPGGAMALAYNSYMPPREMMIEIFAGAGLTPVDFLADHRMSESIVRDVVVFTK